MVFKKNCGNWLVNLACGFIIVWLSLKFVNFVLFTLIGYRNVEIALIPLGEKDLEMLQAKEELIKKTFLDKYCQKTSNGFYRVDALKILPYGEFKIECKGKEVILNDKNYSYMLRVKD